MKRKKKVGRPFKTIDWKKVEKMCHAQCTEREIAATIGVDVNTLSAAIRRTFSQTFADFSEYFAAKRIVGLQSLRSKQYQLAIKGDRTMLIWLGKQHLSQRDKMESSGPNGGPIAIEVQPKSLSELAMDILKHRKLPSSADLDITASEQAIKDATDAR